jgi:hypothetical protein
VARDVPPPWSSPLQACILIARGYTFRTGAVVASVVGTILSGVNQGGAIASGHISPATMIRIAVNYVLPYIVSSIGYLAPFRQRNDTT